VRAALIIPALVVAMLAGCQSAPAPSLTPSLGMATLRLTVIAEPKTGAVFGNTHVLSYDTPTASAVGSGAFEKVDYTELDDIVVWLEPIPLPPPGYPLSAADRIDINRAKPGDGLSSVETINSQIVFRNTGNSSVNLYSVSDGNEFDLGEVAPGNWKTYRVQSSGLIEVLTDSMQDPVARIYAAPSYLVRMAHAGQTVDFTDLKPGPYKVVSWHPRLPGREIMLTLPPNQISSASIKVGVNELPKIDAP